MDQDAVDNNLEHRHPVPPGDPVDIADRPVVTDAWTCDRLLRSESLGRVAYVVDGWPVVLPVNYGFDGPDLVLRTDAHSNLAALSRTPLQVALEVDSTVRDFKSGWSVLVHGMAETVANHRGPRSSEQHGVVEAVGRRRTARTRCRCAGRPGHRTEAP